MDTLGGHILFVYIYAHPVNWARKMSFLQLSPILCVGIITTREKFFQNRISAIWKEKKKSQESFHMIDGMKGKLLMEHF